VQRAVTGVGDGVRVPHDLAGGVGELASFAVLAVLAVALWPVTRLLLRPADRPGMTAPGDADPERDAAAQGSLA
jgi:hypothetical protein